jgi:hypothetical protein
MNRLSDQAAHKVKPQEVEQQQTLDFNIWFYRYLCEQTYLRLCAIIKR